MKVGAIPKALRTQVTCTLRWSRAWTRAVVVIVCAGCVVATVLSTGVGYAMADSHLIVKRSSHTVSDTLDRLSDVLKTRGISVVARVDHAGAAAKSGMSLRPTAVLIFGNPKLGTPLMQANQKVGLDLPMKVLVWQDESNQVWLAYAKPERLKADYGLEGQDATLRQMADALNNLTDAAVQAK
jgi:uncharacterized protein (DUF302 family)